jgi:hypothetical protein
MRKKHLNFVCTIKEIFIFFNCRFENISKINKHLTQQFPHHGIDCDKVDKRGDPYMGCRLYFVLKLKRRKSNPKVMSYSNFNLHFYSCGYLFTFCIGFRFF